MTQKNKPGYPLPPGELGEDEIVCQLVYLPNRNEYWQALLGAISYMSTWKAWERDADKRGKDAASNWREAFELTIGCWRMTCLEDLTNTVTDILELLQTRKDCCDDNLTYLPVDPIETDIEPYEGDPPEFYGETEIEDWTEWSEHVCYNAHKYVDYLAHVGDELWDATRNSAIFLGLIAALLSLLAFSGIGLPIAFGLAATVVSGIILTGTIATFEGSKEAIEAAREDIVCAILYNTGLSQAVEDALDSGVDWDLFYQFIQYDDAMAIIYDGGFSDEYLPSETNSDCSCLTIVDMDIGDSISGFKTLEINSKYGTGSQPYYEQIGVSWYWGDGETLKNIKMTAISGTPNPENEGTGSTYWARDENLDLIWDSDDEPQMPFVCARFWVTDSPPGFPTEPVEFDYTITWEHV
jgi:hypothetical protein